MFALRPQPAARPRHLICLDLVRSALDAKDAHSARRAAVCRRLLRHARWRGWDLTHVHPRSAAMAARPVEGLEPLPSERLVYRTGVSAFSNRVFGQAVRATPEAELVLACFSLSSACLVTALTAHDLGLPVTLVEDAALGDCGAHNDDSDRALRAVVTPFVRVVLADDLIEMRRALHLVAGE